MLLLANCAAALASVNLPYYLEYILHLPSQRGSILFTLFLAAILSVPIWVQIAKHYGKTESFRVAMVLYVIVLSFMPFLGPETKNIIYIYAVFIGFFHAAAITLPWAIIPDVVEVDELKTGKRREGLFYGGTTFSYKAATGAAILLSACFLELSGYTAGPSPSEVSLKTMRFLSGPAPSLFLLAAAILALRYPLNAHKHKLILEELQARKANS
jgi:GPH family glycoside/pentoside/hexuronide:cation symporter